jgi:hypothetical protein
VPLYVTQLVLLKVQPSSPAYVITCFVNNYVAVICAVFATGEPMQAGLACEYSWISLVWSTGISRAAPSVHDAGVREPSSMRFASFGARTRGRQTDMTVSDIELTPGLSGGHGADTLGAVKPTASMKELDGLHVQVDWSKECSV